MKKIYIILTNNRFNEVLVFTNYKKAFNWCKSATNWNNKKIKEEIKTPLKVGDFFAVFPEVAR